MHKPAIMIVKGHSGELALLGDAWPVIAICWSRLLKPITSRSRLTLHPSCSSTAANSACYNTYPRRSIDSSKV